MTKRKPEENEFVCDVCGWDAKKKSKAESKAKALAQHKKRKHPQGEGGGSPKKGGTGMELKGKKAKLRGDLRKLKMRLKKLPRDVQEMATSELEMINEYVSGLAVSKNPSEEELEMIEMAIEDDLKWAMKDYEDEAKESDEVEKKEESKKKDSVDILEEELNEEMQQLSREYRVERMQQQIEDLRKRRGKPATGQQDDGGELKSRTLPDGQIVKMTDKDYVEWSIQYEALKTKRSVDKDADKVEFLYEDPKTGKPVPIKVSSEAYFRYIQSSGTKGQSDEVKRMMEESQKNEANLRRQLEDQRWNVVGKEISDLKGQVAYNPMKDFMTNMNMLREGGLMPTEGGDVQLQLVKNQGKFTSDMMDLAKITSAESTRIMGKAADAYIDSKAEEKKEKIRTKSVLRDQRKGLKPPGPEDLGKLSEKVEKDLGERGATGYYFCSKCQGDHGFNSELGQKHITYREAGPSEKNQKKGKEVGHY